MLYRNRYNVRDKIQQGNFLSKNICAGDLILIFRKIGKRFFFTIKMYIEFSFPSMYLNKIGK